MKKIRIKICEFGRRDDELRENFIYKILQKYYDVEFSENPEYVFYNESSYEHLNYNNCIKIFYTGENMHPNFNLCDYAVGFDYLTFDDRYYRLPLYLITVFYNQKDLELAGDTDFKNPAVFTREDLAKKIEFCSFVYSNYLANDNRVEIFNKLSRYKKVNSGGGYMNNIGGRVASKMEFELKHKFSVAFENSFGRGYTTEKLVNSLAAKTIPIYWGNPDVGKEFNTKRFINCHEYANFDEVVERVKEIDNNDDLYLSIVNQSITVENYNFQSVRQGFEEFLRRIIDRPFESARRKNSLKAIEAERNERALAKYVARRAAIKKFFAALYQPLKKLRFLEKLKLLFFKKCR